MKRRWFAGALAAGAFALASAQEDPVQMPRPGVEERVELNFVLVDFMVLDRNGRTVPDIDRSEIKLKVDGKPTEFSTLDVDCPAGATDEPEAGGIDAFPEDDLQTGPARLVLVFDYFHMENAADALAAAEEMLDRRPQGDEEHMIISMGRVVRVETPMTKDLGEVRWALQRMRNDPDLYGSYNDNLNEYPFFGRAQILMDLLERWPGRKAIVLFSGPFRPDEFLYDHEYKELASLAGGTRSAIYPVDSAGMRAVNDPKASRLGGPENLRRLANETGGRMSADSNDISLAYARARRDLGCTYTLGFEDRSGKFDDSRRLTLKIKREGARAVYPDYYVARSDKKRNESLRKTATEAPHFFESPEVRTELFVLGASSYRAWDTMMVVEIDLPSEELEEKPRDLELKGLVRKSNGTILRTFRRKVTLPARREVDGERFVGRYFETQQIETGRVIVSAVLLDKEGGVPRASTRSAGLSRIPEERPFVAGPIVGHTPQADGGKRKKGKPPEFEPLVGERIEPATSIDALTTVCGIGVEKGSSSRLQREIVSESGAPALALEARGLEWSGDLGAECHSVIDALPTAGLSPGSYRLLAWLDGTGGRDGAAATRLVIQANGE